MPWHILPPFLTQKRTKFEDSFFGHFKLRNVGTIWSENRQSLQVPACLCNTLTPFLTTFGSSFGPWELLKKENYKISGYFFGVFEVKVNGRKSSK